MKELIIYYDKDCPFCSKYSELVKLRSSYKVNLLNARDFPEAMNRFLDLGMDINEGFIIQVGDEFLQGDKAVVFLSKEMRADAFFDSLLLRMMKNKYFMLLVYPIVKKIRIVLLWIIGKNHRIKLK